MIMYVFRVRPDRSTVEDVLGAAANAPSILAMSAPDVAEDPVEIGDAADSAGDDAGEFTEDGIGDVADDGGVTERNTGEAEGSYEDGWKNPTTSQFRRPR